jgi:hypothetical protein
MGFSQDYADVPNWVSKPEGYQTGAMVKYQGNVFYANFWATEPGVGDANSNGWRFYDELYDQTSAHTPQTKDILAQFPQASRLGYGNIQVPGSTPTPPFISPPGTYQFQHNIYFETPRMAVEKLQFLKEIGAQGVIIWELSNDVWEEGKSIIKVGETHLIS